MSAYPLLTQITDPTVRQVLKLLFDRVGAVEAQASGIGAVTQPLARPLNANKQQLKAVADPTAATDAVTLQYLQRYVEGRIGPLLATTAALQSAASALPAEAPNMLTTLQGIEAGFAWQLNNGDAYDQTQADGRGGLTEAIVTALHAIDAGWGHINKVAGQNRYNGHAVDAIVWKNPDGVTGEIYDVVGSHVQWIFISRDAAGLALWKYPA